MNYLLSSFSFHGALPLNTWLARDGSLHPASAMGSGSTPVFLLSDYAILTAV